ncbi:uncharacterized protein FA14DRAFT_190323 [Meira miltonrushii]|uniref:Uncharacterized protein n=1 Tax=Meira miltonrushii TaxID=1280837 RepID=A0A316V6J0_9BASI|nr:uncharacterized protein FA14DRAFT_190323 [Meira miltonrushii]PWN33136.1 hypothetical protein FA14DRAFT_190323 [Meira miltonrushii]
MTLNAFGISSTLFLILYALLFIFLMFNYATKRFTLRSRWSLILFHVTLRLAAQSVGLAFSLIGFKAVSLLIASLVLSAEGYFSLVLCVTRLLISWQRHYLPEKHSCIIRSPINAIHWILNAGNVLIITGGNFLASGKGDSASENWNTNTHLTASKIMRGTGQGICLATAIFLYGCLFFTLRRAHSRNATKEEVQARIVLVILAITFPFMMIRGVFGILQGVIDSLNYYYPGIYNSDGFTSDFVVKEAVLTTMTEWCTCTLLLSTSLLRATKKESQHTSTDEDDHEEEGAVKSDAEEK